MVQLFFNSLPNNKILDWSKLKAFADDKIKIHNMIIFVFGRVENIVGKGESFFPRVVKVEIVWQRVNRVENFVKKGENAGYKHFLLFQISFNMAIFSSLLLCIKVLRHSQK